MNPLKTQKKMSTSFDTKLKEKNARVKRASSLSLVYFPKFNLKDEEKHDKITN